jgi:Polyketide cyclase / dehydrase and lipid transport
VPRYLAILSTPVDAEDAFEDLSHFDRASEWDPGVESGSMLSPAPVALDSRFELRARFLGRTVPLRYVIVELVPGRRVVFEARTPFFTSRDTITFEPSDAPVGAEAPGCVVTYDALLTPRGVARVASPLLALAFRKLGELAHAGLRERLGAVPS